MWLYIPRDATSTPSASAPALGPSTSDWPSQFHDFVQFSTWRGKPSPSPLWSKRLRRGALDAAPVWGDARTVPGRRFRGCVDLVFAGIPCQPYSVAGAQAGADDDRDLWPALRRLIVQCRPQGVFIENVGGLLSDDACHRIFRSLRRLGFTVEGGLFTASEVGAPQERERLFILALAKDWRPGEPAAVPAGPVADPDRAGSQVDPRQPDHPRLQQPPAVRGGGPVGHPGGDRRGPGAGEVRPGWDAAERSGADLRTSRSLYARAGLARPGDPMGDTYSGRHRRGPDEPVGGAQRRTAAAWSGAGSAWPPGPLNDPAWRELLAVRPRLEPVVRREADGLADRLDRLRLLGNGVVPLEAAYAFRTLAARLATYAPGATRFLRLTGG